MGAPGLGPVGLLNRRPNHVAVGSLVVCSELVYFPEEDLAKITSAVVRQSVRMLEFSCLFPPAAQSRLKYSFVHEISCHEECCESIFGCDRRRIWKSLAVVFKRVDAGAVLTLLLTVHET